MFKSILLVFSACFVWGLIFVIPGLMIGFSSLEIALGRYFFLGIGSCAFLLIKGFHTWQRFSWSIWRQAILYALFVNIIYYFSLVTGLLYSSPSVIALLLGISPISITFYGNWRKKECSYRQLLVPCLLICCGLLCVNWPAFTSLPAEASWKYGFGLLCGLLSLIIWNWYVIANADFLKENPTVSSSDWSTLIGIATFLWVLAISSVLYFFVPTHYLHKYFVLDSTLISFIFGGIVLGLVCSWLGSYFWNVGSQALPISLAGQLTIFETIFGLIFVYILEQRLPNIIESIGIFTILSGVSLSMMLFNKSVPFVARKRFFGEAATLTSKP